MRPHSEIIAFFSFAIRITVSMAFVCFDKNEFDIEIGMHGIKPSKSIDQTLRHSEMVQENVGCCR